jgi:hypothetical protein
LVAVASHGAGVEFKEQLSQLRELLRSDLSGELVFDPSDRLADVLCGCAASFGGVDASGAMVLSVVLPGEVPEVIEPSEEVVHSPVLSSRPRQRSPTGAGSRGPDSEGRQSALRWHQVSESALV